MSVNLGTTSLMEMTIDFINRFIRPIMIIFSVTLISLGCLLIFQTVYAANFYDQFGAFDLSSKTIWPTVMGCHLVLLSLLGFYGAIYNKKKITRWIAFWTAFNMVAGIVFIVIVLPSESTVHDRLKTLMLDAQKYYDWTDISDYNSRSNLPLSPGNDTELLKINSTKLWDQLQRGYKCCGLTKRDDWNSFRPKDQNKTSEIYPKSCCLKPNKTKEGHLFCEPKSNSADEDSTKHEAWIDGCLSSAQELMCMLSKVVRFTLVANFVIAIVTGLSGLSQW